MISPDVSEPVCDVLRDEATNGRDVRGSTLASKLSSRQFFIDQFHDLEWQEATSMAGSNGLKTYMSYCAAVQNTPDSPRHDSTRVEIRRVEHHPQDKRGPVRHHRTGTGLRHLLRSGQTSRNASRGLPKTS